jgi:Flp pilus assembly protein TadD
MADGPKRLDGWKEIAAHFRRNRSTVMRWAEAGDFPVHRVRGKAGASVWAYAHDLDAWLARGGSAGAQSPSQAMDGPLVEPVHVETIEPPVARRRARVGISAIVASMLAALVIGVAVSLIAPRVSRPPGSRPATLPADPAIADLYLQARDDWASRTPAGLRKAISELGVVISREPGFAAGHAGLADAYILSREYDGLPDAVAFTKAEAAAKAALAIDPDSADANRALGFIDYWGHHDIDTAREHFRRSLSSNPGDGQTHFWLGNILVETGDYEAAFQELRSARRLAPGSKSIAVDYAWAQWIRGPGDPGLGELQGLSASAPPMGAAHRFLAYIYLAKRDLPAYLDQSEQWAALTANRVLNDRVARERSVYQRLGEAGLLEFIADEHASLRTAEGSPTEWPATAASLLGRRDLLLGLISRAAANHEHWRTWRQDQERFSRWRGDTVVTDGLLDLMVPRSVSN